MRLSISNLNVNLHFVRVFGDCVWGKEPRGDAQDFPAVFRID